MNTTTPNPDFFMVSIEGFTHDEPRKCWRVKQVRNEYRSDLLLTKVAPGFKYRGHSIDEVILATKYEGESLIPKPSYPVTVYVLVPMLGDVNAEEHDMFKSDEYRVLDWADLYETEDQARKYA